METQELAQALALFWGLVTVGLNIPVLLSKKFFEALLRVKEKEEFVILSGLISLTSGAASLAVLHSWEWSLVGVVTVIGWANVIKGIARFFELASAQKAVKKVKPNDPVVRGYMIILTLFGLYLISMGFWG